MKKITNRFFIAACIIIAVVCLFLQYFRLQGHFDKDPVLEIHPKNCYDKTLKVVARPLYNPYTFFDKDGKPTGHDVELINIIANELKMNLDLHFSDWNSAIKAVKNHEADLLLACEFSNRHSPEFELEKTVCTVYDEFAVFGKKQIYDPIQLIDKRIGILKNGNVSSNLYSMGLQDKCTSYETYFATFEALIKDEVDYVIGRNAVGLAILDSLGAKNIKPFISIGSSSMCLGLSPDNTELIAQVNDVLMKLKVNGTLNRLQKKWLTTFVHPYTFMDVMHNNPWLPLTALLILIVTIYISYRWRIESLEQKRALENISQKAGEYHDMLIRASEGYMEINLSKNLIIGNIIGIAPDGTQTNLDIHNYGNTVNYDKFEQWIADNILTSDKNEYLEHSNCQYLISRFNSGQKVVDIFRSSLMRGRKGERHSKLTYYISRNDANSDIMALCLATDITDEINAERKANELRHVLSVMANDYDTIIHFDFDRMHIECFRAGKFFREIKEDESLSFDQFLNYYANEMVIPEDRDEFLEEMKSETIMPILQSGKIHSVRFRHGSQKAPRWIGLTLIHHTEHHESKCAIIAIRDITDEISAEQHRQAELKRQNRELEAARDMAQAANNAKTAFLFNMSHDIRTPMNSILGFTDMAINHIDDKKRTLDCLQKAKTSEEHLLSLINDILEMSRIESGKVQLDEKKINLLAVCEKSIPMLRSMAEQKSIVFKFSDDAIANRMVLADSLRLNQIIINVVSNAIKYTDAGGNVSFTLSQKPIDKAGYGLYCMVIEDTGIGMSKEFQSHIFETFSREKTSTVSGRQGTGLGMAITKNLVDLMGGTIAVASTQGKGSKFTIQIPLRLVGEDSSESTNTQPAQAEPLSLDGKRVLLVDDNELNREIASELLIDNGMEVEMADDGTVAVELVKEKGCAYNDFVLMDIQMPKMDGYEATAQIRTLPDSKSLPIIAISANAFDDDRQKSLNAGMNAHIAKPNRVKELIATLRSFAKP